MEVDIQELWNRLQVEQQYHQKLATAYQAVLNDLQRMLPAAEIKVKSKGNKGKHFSEEHKQKLREAHALRKKRKQEEAEKQRINAEQVRLLQPQAVAK